MTADPETRKAIAQRAIDRAKARGVPIDGDPAFAALLAEWISGSIEMKEMRELYLDILALQEAERRGRWARFRSSVSKAGQSSGTEDIE